MTRYRTAATRADLQTTERSVWSAYAARERQRRGLDLRDSLLTKRGRVIPAAEAAALNIGTIETIAGIEVLIVPGTDAELAGLPEVGAVLVERDALPVPVRDALDARGDARTDAPARVRAVDTTGRP